MKKVSKFLSILLVCVMIVSAAAGCTTTDPTSSSQSGSLTSSITNPPAVSLTWYLGGAAPSNLDAVLKKANALIESKINATLQLKIINFGDYTTKMQMIMSSGENYDIAYTASWANDFLGNVAKGAFIPLDAYLSKYPEFEKIMPQAFWNSAKVNNKLYAVPNLQLAYTQQGIALNKAMCDKYKIDISKINSINDLTPIFQTIKDNEKSAIPLLNNPTFLYIPGISVSDLLPLHVNTNTWKVVDMFTLPYNISRNKLLREWNKKGFFPADVATLTDTSALEKSGNVFCQYVMCKPGVDAELKSALGHDVYIVPTEPMDFTYGSIRASLTAISQTSKNPEKAFELLNLVNTNKEVYNMLSFGVEGQDYKKVSDNRIEPVKDAYNVYDWELGCVFNSYLTPGKTDDVWQQTIANNNSAMVNPLNGFIIDRAQIQSQIAAMTAIYTQYIKIFQFGLADTDQAMADYTTKMKAAGEDTVIAEVQKQLDAWVAANHK